MNPFLQQCKCKDQCFLKFLAEICSVTKQLGFNSMERGLETITGQGSFCLGTFLLQKSIYN